MPERSWRREWLNPAGVDSAKAAGDHKERTSSAPPPSPGHQATAGGAARASGAGADSTRNISVQRPNHAAANAPAARAPARPNRRQRGTASSTGWLRCTPSGPPYGATGGGRVASTTSRIPAFAAKE